MDRDLDPDVLQVLLDDLLHLFPHPVAGGGIQFQRQSLPGGVAKDAVGTRCEPGFLQHRAGPGRIIRILLDGIGVPGMTRRQVRVGHRLLALKQLLGDALTVDAVGQGPANPNVLKERVVKVEVYVLPDQPGFEVHFEPTARLLVQLHRQVKCDPGGADGVDGAGEHVGD